MADLTKKDLKEIFVKSLEPFANAIQKDIQKIESRLDKSDFRMDRLEAKLDILEEDIKEVKADVKEMKENSGALFTKLDRYISFYEALSHDFMAMNVHINRLDDRVAKLEKKQRIK